MTKEKKKGSGLRKFLIVVTVLMSLVTVGMLGALLFYLPWQEAESTMPQDGAFTLEEQKNGTLVLSWTEAEGADCYAVELLIPAASEEEEPQGIYRSIVDGTSCTIPVPANPLEERIIRVSSMVAFSIPFHDDYRYGEQPLEVTTNFLMPEIVNLKWEPDPAQKTVTVTYGFENASDARFYADVNSASFMQSGDTAITLRYGEEGDLPMIPFGGESNVYLDAVREMPGITVMGYISNGFTVVRDNLLDRNLNLKLEDQGYNVLKLTWDETKGEYYEVQKAVPGSEEWEIVKMIPGDGERSYTSPHLPVFDEFTYRVVAVGGETMPDSDLAAESEHLSFATKESPIYATIWPTMELEAYTDTLKSQVAGTVVTGKAYSVLEEQEGFFAVRLDESGTIGYIDSTFCLINLPEYMGDMCAYKITNSESSKFLMHEFKIDGLSGKVIKGYSDIKLADGSYVVPLLYPTAKRLLTAAYGAMEQGYRLKIYDAFRPNVATRSMYSNAEKMLEKNLPQKTYTGARISDLKLPMENIPDGDYTKLLYKDVMLGQYTLNYYVARGQSNHNLGIALDLTIEALEDGREKKMQTSMHDLSQYSALSKNNSNARTLQKIMTAAGFGTLSSEWWHFNDNETKNGFELAVVSEGVSVEGWVADDFGWRYRLADGTYLTDTTETIGENSYSFDAQGYLRTDESIG